MGNISTTTLVIVLLIQIILLLCSFLWFNLYKIKNLNKQLKQAAEKPAAESKDGAQSDKDLESYLKAEADKTRQQIEQLKEKDADKDVSGLNLRLELLNFELGHLVVTGADEKPKTKINWDEINLKVSKILSASGQKRNSEHLKNALENNENAPPPSESLLEQQNKTIEHLKAFINDLLGKMDAEALPNNELDTHFEKIDQAKVELEQCVLILEDENSFLRDQIAALLKVNEE